MYSRTDLKKIADKLQAGFTYPEVMAFFGCSRGTVAKAAKIKRDPDPVPEFFLPTSDQIRMAYSLLSGKSIRLGNDDCLEAILAITQKLLKKP